MFLGSFYRVRGWGLLEHGRVDAAVRLRDPDLRAEGPERGRGYPAAAHAADGWHARVIPAVYLAACR